MIRNKWTLLAWLVTALLGAVFVIGLGVGVSDGDVAAKYLPAGKLDEDKLDFYSANSILFYDNSCVIPTAGGGIWKGKPYILTMEELYNAIHLAYHEEPTFEGLKFELTFFANFADAYGYSSIHSAVCDSRWFGEGTLSACSNYSRGSITDEDIEAAKDVLINGNRVAPPQILEHDCIGDFVWLEVGGTRHYNDKNCVEGMTTCWCNGRGLDNESYYVPGETVVHNVYGSTYIFYAFPQNSNLGASNAFGYFEDNPPDAASLSSGGGQSVVTVKDVDSVEMTLIGDSVAVKSESELRNKFKSGYFTMNTLRSLSVGGSGPLACPGDEGAKTILEKLASGTGEIITQHSSGSCEALSIDGDSLRDVVVWEIGANPGGIDRASMEEVIGLIGDRKLFLVTPYDNDSDLTNTIALLYRSLADEYDNVYLVDWNEKVKGTGDKYLVDGLDPNSEGAQLLVDLIEEAILGSYSCMPAVGSSEYQERLSNLHDFSQNSGTWRYSSRGIEGCKNSGTGEQAIVMNTGCGLMSIYAAYYMFTGDGLNDESVFNEIADAAKADGYYSCAGATYGKFGNELEKVTGMTLEELYWGSYSDSRWEEIVNELKKGKKLLISATGTACSGSSIFAGCAHALLLDHYDESKDAVFLFDPDMNEYRASTSGGSRATDNVRDGIYLTRNQVRDYLKPDSAFIISYYDDCYNVCVANSDGLVAGGMTYEQAVEFMKKYREEASFGKRGSYGSGYTNKTVIGDGFVFDAGCVGGALNNCVAFSQWFVNNYTQIGPNFGSSAGSEYVDMLIGGGLEDGGQVPRAYAIFSEGCGTAPGANCVDSNGTTHYNHTGVILGIDLDKNEVYIGEASCSNGYTDYWPGVHIKSVDEMTNNGVNGYKYAYTDDKLIMEGL